MHPSISKFPNSNFYNSKISDGPNVLSKEYERKYLPDQMYGAYSFINIEHGMEGKDKYGRSLKNMIEVAVVVQILKKLFRGVFPALYCIFHKHRALIYNSQIFIMHLRVIKFLNIQHYLGK